MNLAASRSARRQNKFVMRLGCVLVAVGFLVSSVVTPRAQAVAGVDDAAVVGSMALASYLSATGLELSVIEGGAATVTSGLGAVAGEYAAATGAAASGEAVLGGIAAGTMISTAGTIILSAAAVAACAALAYWLVDTYFVDAEVGTIVNFYNSSVTIGSGGYKVCWDDMVDALNYEDYIIPFGAIVAFDTGFSITAYVSDELIYGLPKVIVEVFDPSGDVYTSFTPNVGYQIPGDVHGWCIQAFTDSGVGKWYFYQIWDKNGIQVGSICSAHNSYKIFGYPVTSSLSATEPEIYNIPEIQPNQQMEITIPSAAPGSTLPELADTVPQLIAQGDFAPAYQVGTATPTSPELDNGNIEDVDDLGLPSLGEALTKRFPFSIPWDIARGITLLAAPAKTPHFEVDFYAPISNRVGGWKGSTKLVLDFSQFESLGRLSRWTSTIGFCLFLASATKRFIWTA